MNVALWIIAGVLAAVCLVGSSKMVVPQEKLAAVGSSAQWVLEFSPGGSPGRPAPAVARKSCRDRRRRSRSRRP
ncbi:hypothetical protein AB0M46_33055 [Dactylosporangium sp. NPDC051485]|uniref:hypothetical protein n=1 Tax=Dactylosporangium sp. NPDC051485 TaxID=3154846 RepID=UPI003442BB30